MIKKIVVAALALMLIAPPVSATETILKFGLSATGPDIAYVGGVFFTPDDGNAGTLGAQDTGIDFTGFLDGILADIIAGASATLENVNAVGAAALIGPVVTQQTDGGTFSVWDAANVLLLQAQLGEGVITGSTANSTGSFFNTEVVSFTGGSLLSLVAPIPGGLSISLANILSNNVAAMVVNNGHLKDFTADATGLVTGNPIPEPSAMLLLGAGAVGLIAGRRKKA